MNFKDALNRGHRFVEGIARSAKSDPNATEPTLGALWKDSYPELQNGVDLYDKIEFSSIPDSRWIDFKWLPGETKSSCRADLNAILDQLLVILGACTAGSIRDDVSNLKAAIATARARIAENERKLAGAPQRESQGIIDGFLTTSREAVEEEIASDQERIEQAQKQITELKEFFRERLTAIGVRLDIQETDTYLLPIEDDIVQMAAVITNVGRLSEQLQKLTEQSREAPEETLRYYGSYVLLLLAVDRIERHFVARVDAVFLPEAGRRRRFVNSARASDG